MSSPRRVVFFLAPSKSDGRIAYNSREKEDSLSLKLKRNGYWIFFPFFSPTFSFPLFYSFLLLFFSFSHFSSYPLSFSPHFLLSFGYFLSLFGATTHSVKKRKFPPLFPQAKCVTFPFSFLFFYFIILFMTSLPTWLNMSHGNHATHVAQCEPFLLCQVSHF